MVQVIGGKNALVLKNARIVVLGTVHRMVEHGIGARLRIQTDAVESLILHAEIAIAQAEHARIQTVRRARNATRLGDAQALAITIIIQAASTTAKATVMATETATMPATATTAQTQAEHALALAQDTM